MDEMFENWEVSPSLPDMDAELKQIRRSLNRHNRKIILTSLVLVLVLMLTVTYVIAPALETLYWAPYTSDYVQQGNDLKWMLEAYTELFHPGKQIQSVYAGDTGFASYDLTIVRTDTATGEKEYIEGDLTRGTLNLEFAFYEYGLERSFFQGNNNLPDEMISHYRTAAMEKLSMLPPFVTVKALVFFPDDLTMEQLQELIFEYNYDGRNGVTVNWVGVRNAPKDAEHAPFAVGFSAKPNGDLSLLDEQYPELGMLHTQADGSQMEEHFKSLLRFSADQLDKGKGIPIVTLTGNYYRDALAYVEENGVTSYGCLITGTPEGLLTLLEDNVASTLILTDGWIDVS